MWGYPGYRTLFTRSGLSYFRLNASRPPPAAPHWRDPATGQEEHDERQCYLDSTRRGHMADSCRLFYRSNSELQLPPAQLCRALRQAQIESMRYVPEVCRAAEANEAEPAAPAGGANRTGMHNSETGL
jgi:hypothetical protein